MNAARRNAHRTVSPCDFIFTHEQAKAGAREFYDPKDVACGVYLVLSRDMSECVYVGSSNRLCDRLRNGNHMPCDAPTFSFEVPELWIREVEGAYFFALNPRMNRICPPGGVYKEAAALIRVAWGKQ